MPNLNLVRAEIDRMRVQIGRQRRDILELRQAGIATGPSYSSGKRILGTPSRRRA
jgi:hypothetical protein